MIHGTGQSGATVKVDHVVVKHSAGIGVQLWDGGRFAAGSTNLSVSFAADYPIAIAPGFATLPTGGSFTNNPANAVALSHSSVQTTQTWPNLGIPYVITSEVIIEGTETPILTLVPGTELRFGVNGGIIVGYNNAGGLQAKGTEAAPIRFTANAATPTAGHWYGLTVTGVASNTLLEHVIVEYGGRNNGYGGSNVVVTEDVGPIMRNSTLRYSSSCGVVRYSKPFVTDFTAAGYNNSFVANASAAQCGPN